MTAGGDTSFFSIMKQGKMVYLVFRVQTPHCFTGMANERINNKKGMHLLTVAVQIIPVL